MVLETTMVCLDNSEWMRNGDYGLSRLEAQNEAATNISRDRTASNPENTVGILAMAGKGVELLVSPTEDFPTILGCFSKMRLGGQSDFVSSVQIAQLALKHRKNKNGGQRIIVFVGSPLSVSVEVLSKIGKQLKKNNVAVDVISMGELDENNDKLTEFIGAVNSGDNSHLVNVPPGVLPTDVIRSSPIMGDSSFGGGGGFGSSAGMGGGMGGDDFGGIDPSMDPELAMAIRLSTEDARAQEEARARAAISESSENISATPVAAGQSAMDDEELLMQQALELSMREVYSSESGGNISSFDAPVGTSTSTPHTVAVAPPATSDGDDFDDEDALARALELSMVESSTEEALGSAVSGSTTASVTGGMEGLGIDDPEFLSSLLGSVDVDMNDPLIQAALAQLMGGGSSENNNDPSKDDKGAQKRKHGDDGSSNPGGTS